MNCVYFFLKLIFSKVKVAHFGVVFIQVIGSPYFLNFTHILLENFLVYTLYEH
ncbi:hypothetical protein SAMN05421863_101941 [Nitrosomonas communis]|uniref:Uncharacterized protein n=1 Tax=Nitrosomonas communis TaxID=44574 RepID=A0A1I4PCY8_9PROT|nr:hypothetical protein SAMN05421863_101941 [Nitrosomonas communis]